MRQANGEVAEGADPWLQLRLPVVVRDMLRQLFGCALGTEVVCVRVNSVMAIVRAGDDDGEQLPLGPRELRGPEHDRPVKAHRGTEDPRVERHRLDDVEDFPRPRDRRVVLALELADGLVLADQPQMRHDGILPYELHEGVRNAISCPAVDRRRQGGESRGHEV
jgi:hypothetical protein